MSLQSKLITPDEAKANDLLSCDGEEPMASSFAPSAAEPMARDEDEISLLDLLIVVAEQKRTVLWFTAISAIAAALVSFLLPVRYTATVTLLPPPQNSSLSTQLASQFGAFGPIAALAGGGFGFMRNPNDMYVAMFKSRAVENAMVQRFGLMQEYDKKYLSDARKKFEHYAIVDGSGKDGLLHISVEDRDPQRAAQLANGYVDQFRSLSEHLAVTEAGQRRMFFEQQLKQANQNLGVAEEALKQTEEKTGLIQPDSQARALIESAAALRAQITAREVLIQGMQTYATGQNAQVVEAQQELASLKAQLAKLGGSGDDSGEIIVPKGEMTAAGMEYVRRLRDVKYCETVFEILARQFELAKLDEAKEGAVIQVVDPGTIPDKRSFPRRSLIVIGATAGGLVLGIFWVLCQVAFRRMRDHPQVCSKLARLRKAFVVRSPRVARS